ncbi:Methionine synthase vitamin-B12 independent [Emticicia oligotrophica DSM 17448]|uniref:Methionine synthase vitamin-B12 independent n=1 Tax=Emticicia oligotrophica (strain DSM 17448 / CIP 109782 / MTCC 6937 / GPTSA100-15) TaxID=929562 RepID=A0ABM5MZ33_EMTOG|nr:methionine synthase [Emticicia oligotrophica]AFK02351.1 Methionine synthase vitamin-B12 independent [Emticicia oligotrophica DSM 17448]
MQPIPIKTTVVGSWPFPSWLEFASENLDKFGPADINEMIEDAVVNAIHDQVTAGLDVITDGEQTRLDFNLSFYGFIKGIQPNHEETRKFGSPAHDQRGKHTIIEPLTAPKGLGVVEEYTRLKRLAPADKILKASIPGPYTLSGRMVAGEIYKDRWEITEALLPIVAKELEDLVAAGAQEICIDEPSMSCYAYKEDTKRFVDIFNRTVKNIVGKTRIATHLCFGNYKGRSVGKKTIAPMLPDFLDLKVDELHSEMTVLNFAEVHLLERFAEKMDVAVGVIDVKSYYIETVEDVRERIEKCLKYVPAEKLAVAPDCGMSQTARWATKQKIANMCAAAKQMR